MITTRDLNIIEFLNEFNIATTTTIASVFFPSIRTCQNRLKFLVDNNMVRRVRDNVSSEYVYFIKMPKLFKHSLYVTNFYRELYKRCDKIVKFKLEPNIGNIRPDAMFIYQINNNDYLGFLEVEISNKGFDRGKYISFFTSDDYKKILPVKPFLFVVGNKVNVNNVPLDVFVFDTDLNDFRVPE